MNIQSMQEGIWRGRRRRWVTGVGFLVLGATLVGEGCQSVPTTGDASAAKGASPNADVMAGFFSTHCYDCHGAERQKGGYDFQTLMETDGRITDTALMELVMRVVSTGEMPPGKRPQPEPEEVTALLDALRHDQEMQIAAIAPDPGRVTVRRLNRMEYNNTVRDLLGVESQPSDAFPPDDTGYGFDTIGDVLTLSPLLAEKYLDAAEGIAKEAVTREVAIYDKSMAMHRKVLVCNHAREAHTERCADRIIRELTPRAYRRPATREELDQIRGFYQLAIDNGDTFYDGIELVVQALLVSPHFLFRIEEEKALEDPEHEYRVNNYEYASRLSYFLWSSMPDDELMACAQDGTIWHPRTLRDQVRRMLRDPRAASLAESFGGQWLEIRNLAVADPDPEKFPEFDDGLRLAMAEETNLFFGSIIAEDRSVLDFIDADYTYVNEPLAALYGIDGIVGPAFQRVPVNREERGGILGQASVLTVTSYPARTSPVLRGVWILDKILAAEPPPPPPDVPALEEAQVDPTATFREKLEAHRDNASCASCHDRIDPLGFGLENYGPIGGWRADADGKPVDSSGVLPDGRTFAGPGELKKILLERKTDFARCLTEKMLTYGLGRGLEDYDAPAVAAIVGELEKNDYRFSALIYEIVRSLPFRKQRGEPEVS